MRTRTRISIVLLCLALLLASLACAWGDDWDGMDRSGFGWSGEYGDDSANIYVVETRAAAPTPTHPPW